MNGEILANLEKSRLIEQTIKALDIVPPRYEWELTWESIKFPEGYEKPPKEEFEAKLQEVTDAQSLEKLRTKRNALLDHTDRYATLDYPHSNLAVQQGWFDQRQTLRDLPTLVTPKEGGSMKLWVTNEKGSLQVGDSLVASNISGYFTKGSPVVVTIKDACDFSESTTETYYSNIVSVTESNVVNTSETAQEGYTENVYWSSNTISHYVGNVVSYYSNVVVYDGVNVYTNVEIAEYSNLEADAQSNFTGITKSNTSQIEIEGFTPVLSYSNIGSDLYDANFHGENYTKIVTHYTNVSVVETLEYSNITSNAYEALDTAHIVTPAYTSFYHEASNSSIRVEQYAELTPEQRTEYTIQSVPAVTSNLQSFYTPQTKTIVHELRYLDASGALTDQANAVSTARQVECTFPTL